MSVRIKLNDRGFKRHLRSATGNGLKRAAVFYHSQTRIALNKPNTGVRVPAKSVSRQAKEQLTNKKTGVMASSGLIRVQHSRTVRGGDGKRESFEAWYWFDKAAHATVKKSVTIYPNPAPVGQPPHKRTGFGQSNVVWEFNESRWSMSARVGVRKNALYLYFHEVGIRGKKRPWLVPTLMKNREMIARLACTGGGSAGSAPRSGGGGN